MLRQQIFYKALLLLVLYSCSDINHTGEVKTPIIIDIQPFSDISKEKVGFVYKELIKIYPNVIIKEPIDLPEKAYYKSRNRYRADSLINFFKNQVDDGHLIIALTTKDISWTNSKSKDYGIFGLGLSPGKVCVASSFRLSKTDNANQLFKVSIHELGHTQGLPHCPVKTCFMRDAKGKNPTNEETEFCPKCKTHLIDKGWAL